MEPCNTRYLSWDLLKNERSRRVTFRKRKNGLLKKAYELNTLCDVKGCVITYERNSDGQLLPPEVYPEPEEVKKIIKRYASCSSKKVYNLDDFYAEKIMELQKETKKLRQQNVEARFAACGDRIDALSLDELRSLAQYLDHKIEAAAARRRPMQCATHEGLPRPMPLYPYASSSGSDVMYDNGRDLQEEHTYAQGLYNNLDHEMLALQQQTCSAGMMPWTDSKNEYAPSTLKVMFNDGMEYEILDEKFHNLAPTYPMSMSALFPLQNLVSPQKLPSIKSRARCQAMQPSLENLSFVSSHEDLRRLEV